MIFYGAHMCLCIIVSQMPSLLISFWSSFNVKSRGPASGQSRFRCGDEVGGNLFGRLGPSVTAVITPTHRVTMERLPEFGVQELRRWSFWLLGLGIMKVPRVVFNGSTNRKRYSTKAGQYSTDKDCFKSKFGWSSCESNSLRRPETQPI